MQIQRATDRVGQRGPAEWFTGEVWLTPVAEAPPPGRMRASRVTFTPGARTAWHTHPLGQALEVLSGIALIGRAGGTAERLGPGDRVWFDPGERHWHGAASDEAMVHLALQEAGEDGALAGWEEHVDDSTYAAACRG